MGNSYGIDMGTNNLKIYNSNTKDVLNIKNTIAIVENDEMYAYGDEAYLMYEKTPETITVSFPIVSGVIADFDNMQTMLFEVLEKKVKAKLKGADIVVTVPTDITEVEKKAFYDMFAKAKIRPHNVMLCEKPLADALGMGLDITEPTGIMVVDFGADTTEISVISLGGLVLTELCPLGGNQIDDSIVTHMKRKYNLLIGRKSACQLKESIGSAMPGREDKMTVVGRDVVSGLPIEMEVDSATVYEGMKSDLTNLCNSIRIALEKVPPELAKDIVNSGIYLTGGSAQTHRLADLFTEVTNIQVNISENARETTVLGLEKVLSDSKYKKFGYEMKTRIFK
ncbi:MAG: rod shape-determining protein [Lachnospiraceae bacterium]|nr:rod shape-determining protein [Lachnospiraceae bacterium]MDD6192382.1 rod shape-determining protein [Lachnospiraceae bacterium]MDY4793979.1 rod shape-determining protein [Pararoseburia sp.]